MRTPIFPLLAFLLAMPGADALDRSLAQRSIPSDALSSPHYETPSTRFLRASLGEEMTPHTAHPATPGVISLPTIEFRSFDDPPAPASYVYLTTPLVAAAEAAGFPGEVIDEVIVPVPSEIFMVMDKLGKPDWKSELRQGKTPTFSNRIDVALLLGNVVAEGFVAVQAEDRASVERIGKDVLKLAESLGLKDTVLPHTNSILEASKNSHWEIVRVELDKTQKTVRDTMEERRDAELAQCVSLGGWLRGTEAVTDLITKNYTSDAAELLNQPDIIQHFQKELKKLSRKNSKLKAMLDGLTTISGVIGTGDEPPTADGVKTINTTTARLVKSITSSASVAQ